MNYESKLIECEKKALEDIFKRLHKDEKMAAEIVAEMSCEMTDDIGIPMLRAALSADAAGLLNLFTSLIYKAAKHKAEYQAIDMAEQWEQNEEREHAEKRAAMAY